MTTCLIESYAHNHVDCGEFHLNGLDYNDHFAVSAFAEYGFAGFSAQKLEDRLVTALQVALVRSGKYARVSEVVTDLEKHSVISMGTVLSKLRPYLADADLEADLTEAVNRRNYLVHQFFRSRQSSFISVEEEVEVIEACRSASALFQNLADRVIDLIKRDLDVIGGSPDDYIAGLSKRIEELEREN